MNETNQIIAVFIVRVFFGMIILLQGYDKVFRVGIKQVIETIQHPLHDIRHIPKFFLAGGVIFTSFVELIGGMLLIIGFLKHLTLYLIALDIIIAAIGLGIMKPMWDMKHVFPRFIMLVFLLIMPSQWDVICVDHVISIISISK